jgi:hypothetical protein
MSVYAGIDVHRKRSQVAVIDADGEVLANRNVPNGIEPILGVIGGLPAGTATAAARIFPDASPPPTTTRAAAAEEATPPASSDQPASGASAPCRVKRRKMKPVASPVRPAEPRPTPRWLHRRWQASAGHRRWRRRQRAAGAA